MRSLLAFAGAISLALIFHTDDGMSRCTASVATCHATLNR